MNQKERYKYHIKEKKQGSSQINQYTSKKENNSVIINND